MERQVGLTAALRVCWACAAAFPVVALAVDDTTVVLERAASKTGVPLIDCKVAADEPELLLGWRMWWEKKLAPYHVGGRSPPPVADTPVATTQPAPLEDSSVSLELLALPEGEAVEPVLIANLPDWARTLPAPLELPDTPGGGRGFELADPIWRQPNESSSLEWRLLRLRSSAAVVVDQEAGRLLYAKNPEAIMSIASITKLMTAMVVLDSGAPLDELLTIEAADVDVLKGSSSRLRLGTRLTRREMLRLMLMSSENRAAAALARSYPQGKQAFVDAMNAKAKALGMDDTRFLDPTGLNAKNRSTAFDLAVMVNAGYQYPLIRDFTTTSDHRVALDRGRHRQELAYHNSNGLVGSERWDIGLSKTGYISEAGRCLVLQATIAAKPVIIVLLDSFGRFTRLADANRIKRWIEGVGTTSISRRRM